MRDANDLTDLIVKHSPRRSRRRLFSGEEAQQYLLGDGGPLLDQNIGMDDLDPAFPDYNVSGLYNSVFRDADTEDDTADYWTIENGEYPLTVEDCPAAPGQICMVFTATGSTAGLEPTRLISAAVPTAPGFDYIVVLMVGNQKTSKIKIKPYLYWYDEEEQLIGYTTGKRKGMSKKVIRWNKIPRSGGAQAASFVSLVLEFSSTAAGTASLWAAAIDKIQPWSGKGDADTKDDNTPESPVAQFFLYDDFNRVGLLEYASQGEFADEVVLPLPDGIEVGDTVVVVWGLSSSTGGVSEFWRWDNTGSYDDWHNIGSSFNGDAPSIGRTTMNIRKITGTEGFTGTNDEIVITNASDQEVSHTALDQLWSLSFIVKDVADLGSPDDDIGWNGSPSANPPTNTLDPKTGWTNWTVDADPCLWFFWAVSDKPIVGAFPAGTTVIFDESVVGLGNSSEFHMMVGFFLDDSTTHGMGTIDWDALGYGMSALGALKAGSASGFGLGTLPLGVLVGAPWEGGSLWLGEADLYSGDGFTSDGQWQLDDNHARADEGLEQQSYQVGSTWERATLDDANVVEVAEGLTALSYSEGTSFYELLLPDGCDVPGRHLIAWIAAEPIEDLIAMMVTRAGWTKLLSAAGTTFFWKRLGGADGTDPTGYDAEDAVEEIEVDDTMGVTPVIAATVLLVEGLYDEGTTNPGPTIVEEVNDSSALPDPITPAWGDGNNVLYMTGIRAEAEITDGPDAPFNESGSGFETWAATTDLGLRADYAVEVEQTMVPETYAVEDDMAGSNDSVWTIAFRAGGSMIDPEGGYVTETERPDGPHNYQHQALIKFRVTDSDAGAFFSYNWLGCVQEGNDIGALARVAYDVTGTTLNVYGVAPVAITDLIEGNWYFLLLDMTGDLVRAKIWPEGQFMPANWQTEGAYNTGQDLFAALWLEGITASGSGFEIDDIWIAYPSEEGTSGRAYIGIADGTSVTYQSTLQWTEGGPRVYVDGYVTILKGYDSDNWTFEFDRAPSYGARIEVEV
jgi:hypothetical protein